MSATDTVRKRRRSLSLAARFTLFVCTLVLLVGLTAILVLRGESERQARRYVRATMSEVGALYANRIGALLASGGAGQVSTIAGPFFEMPSVVAVRAEDAFGRPYFDRAKTGYDPLSRRIEQFSFALTHQGKRFGRLHVAVSPERMATGATLADWPAFAGLAALVFLAIPLTILMVSRVTRPLRQLTGFAEKVAATRLSERIDIQTGDEFETLAGAFNHMMSRLDSSVRRVQRLAFVDPVTDLPNAERLQRELRIAIDASLGGGAPGALFVLQLDGLQRAEESLGREAANEILAAAATRLAGAARAAEAWAEGEGGQPAAVVARLSGGEFAVLLASLPHGAELRKIANALMQPFDQAFEWREHHVTLTCQLGAAFFPRDGNEPEALMRHVRLALNAARETPLRMRFFTKSLDRAAAARVNLEREMRAALEQNQFRAYFQPKVSLRNGRIIGAEALARWVRPDRSIISPGKFIPAAEEMGLICPISEAVLRDACWKAAAWSREGLSAQISVNVSVLQFADDSFPDKVLKILDHAGLPPQCLELEITESLAMHDIERAIQMIDPLRARGVRFAIDDFGTGHSSLGALTRLPFEVLKIDQTFIRGLSNDRHAPAIVETILAMAASLNYDAVAEGVETEEEAEFLRRRGCPSAQGFLFSAAVPPADFLRLLRNGIIPVIRPIASVALDPAA